MSSGEGNSDTGECHEPMEAEIRVMCLQPKRPPGLPAPLGKSQPCSHIDFGRGASRTVGEPVSVILSPSVVVLCYGSPRELIDPVVPVFLQIGKFLAPKCREREWEPAGHLRWRKTGLGRRGDGTGGRGAPLGAPRRLLATPPTPHSGPACPHGPPSLPGSAHLLRTLFLCQQTSDLHRDNYRKSRQQPPLSSQNRASLSEEGKYTISHFKGLWAIDARFPCVRSI